MAYTTPNTRIIRPWDKTHLRYVHRRSVMTIDGAGAAEATQTIPAPGRLVSIAYGAPNTTESMGIGAALTSGALTVKSETTAGIQLFTDADLSSVPTLPTAVGTTSGDETGAATAATDAFSGGLPCRSGTFLSVASGTEAEVLVVDCYYRLSTYILMDLVAQSGADGTGAVTRYVPLGGPGVLAAITVDYQNTPATADILIKADSTNGPTLNGRASSQTDLAPRLMGAPGMDEAAAATAATDGTESGLAFKRGLFFDIAQSDIFTNGNERIIIECWVDQ